MLDKNMLVKKTSIFSCHKKYYFLMLIAQEFWGGRRGRILLWSSRNINSNIKTATLKARSLNSK